jgi:hypothetical protein
MIFLLKKESVESKLYIITDTIFKTSIALFVISYFFLLNKNAVINYHEKSFFVAAGLLLLVGIDYKKAYVALTRPSDSQIQKLHL